jgi:hypothetical protein
MLAFCEKRLGHFKTPTRIHFVNDLPKGPSGKVQRLRLLSEVPATVATVHSNGHLDNAAAPAAVGVIEEIIARSWAEVLEQPQVDRDGNFFSLGGHSLMAIQCLSLMRDELPVPFSLSDFFEHPTIAEQVALIEGRLSAAGQNGSQVSPEVSSPHWKGTGHKQHSGVTEKAQTIPKRGKNLPYPLSSGQQRIWFFEELAPEVPLYNESEAVRLIGELRADALEQALNLIIARHEILRTTIQIAAERPIAVVHDTSLLQIKHGLRGNSVARALSGLSCHLSRGAGRVQPSSDPIR